MQHGIQAQHQSLKIEDKLNMLLAQQLTTCANHSPYDTEHPGNDPRHDPGLRLNSRPDAGLALGAGHLLGIRAERVSLAHVLNDHRRRLLLLGGGDRVSGYLLLGDRGRLEAAPSDDARLGRVVARGQVARRRRPRWLGTPGISFLICHHAEEAPGDRVECLA